MKKSWMVIISIVAVAILFAVFPRPDSASQSEAPVPMPARGSSAAGQRQSLTPNQVQATEWSKDVEDGRSFYGANFCSAVTYTVLMADGSADRESIRQVVSDADTSDAIAEAFDEARSQMADLIYSKLSVDRMPVRNRDPGAQSYFIAADPAAGDQILGSLVSRLKKLCGEEKAWELYSAFRPYYQFGSFGRQDMRLSISRDSSSEAGVAFSIICLEGATKVPLPAMRLSKSSEFTYAFGKNRVLDFLSMVEKTSIR